jgi:hypothetical protein
MHNDIVESLVMMEEKRNGEMVLDHNNFMSNLLNENEELKIKVEELSQ